MSSAFQAGGFLIDKPVGASSFYMVRKVRNALGMKKVGHAGTLDPFASGLLLICAGRAATKLISKIQDGEKEYVATLRLGRETTTLDPEGEVVRKNPVGPFTKEDIERCLQKFRGEQQQIPPLYSAVKHKGKPLYYYARKGVAITKPPRTVQIRSLLREQTADVLDDSSPYLYIRVVCSKGTYIRTLGADIGHELGCGAYVTALRRVRSGCFHVDDAVDGAILEGNSARENLMEKVLSVPDLLNLLQ